MREIIWNGMIQPPDGEVSVGRSGHSEQEDCDLIPVGLSELSAQGLVSETIVRAKPKLTAVAERSSFSTSRRQMSDSRFSHVTIWGVAYPMVFSIAIGLPQANPITAAPSVTPSTQGSYQKKPSVLHPSAGRWREAGSLIHARRSHTATRLPDGRVLVVGGSQGGEGGELNSTEVYDPKSNHARGAWTEREPLVYPRMGHAAALLSSGAVLVVGGNGPLKDNNILDNRVELYDSTAGHGHAGWREGRPLQLGQIKAQATALADGKILVTGYHFERQLERGEVYDPASNNGQGGSRLTSHVPDLHGGFAITRLYDGKILLAGRRNGVKGCDQPAYVFDPSAKEPSQEWTIVSDGPLNLCSPTATVLKDGRVLLVGSRLLKVGAEEQELPCAYLYSHKDYLKDRRHAWMTIPPPKIGRRGHTATLLLNGLVLIAGGQRLNSGGVGPKDFVAPAELYVPGAVGSPGTWQGGGSMKQARALHTATLLLDGSVLIVGGSHSFFNDTTPLTSVEIYEPGRVK